MLFVGTVSAFWGVWSSTVCVEWKYLSFLSFHWCLFFLYFFQVSTHHLHSSSEDEDIESAFPNELSLQQVSWQHALHYSWEACFSDSPLIYPSIEQLPKFYSLSVCSVLLCFLRYSYLRGRLQSRLQLGINLAQTACKSQIHDAPHISVRRWLFLALFLVLSALGARVVLSLQTSCGELLCFPASKAACITYWQ